MQAKKELEKDREDLLSMKEMTQTYEDVAVAKMQEIRAAVLSTREFLSGVEEIYKLAKAAYLAQVLAIPNKKERQKEIDYIHKNQKTAVVLISGNHSLLGGVIFQTYKVFLQLINKVDCDKVVCGTIGRYLAAGARPRFDFSYFPLEDFEVKDSEIKPIVDLVTKYEKVFLVYPRFQSVLVQVPQIEDISGGITAEESLAGKKRYMFEPSAKEVMTYFEGQIIGILFKQKQLESMLAKYSSRLTVMDEATQTIEKYIKQNALAAVIAGRRASNKKMLNSFSGVSLWEGK
ncbi:MAG TPA: FoF1 ATP synthase subunit gamma [Candidatus Saccharimonadales bacterium]|nr:FoF1 ATP synthase subunit gamma [Candidatus Saccharimonadales bacterium]